MESATSLASKNTEDHPISLALMAGGRGMRP
ncbi:MAG: hypothetical protein ACI945_000648, partial [Pseudohongiellaceae bacterium]